MFIFFEENERVILFTLSKLNIIEEITVDNVRQRIYGIFKQIDDSKPFFLRHTHRLSGSASDVLWIPIADTIIGCKLHKTGISCFQKAVIIAVRDLLHVVSKTEDMQTFRFLSIIPFSRLLLKRIRQYNVQFYLWIALTQFQNGKAARASHPIAPPL